MPMIIKNNMRYCSTGGDAESIVYNNTESGMKATNMQDAIDELNSNLDGEAVLLAEVSKESSKNFTGIDLSPYRSVMLCGYKYASNLDSYVSPVTMPKNLITINTRFWSRYITGGTYNSFGLSRTADQTFTLEAHGNDNYGARFYGIK